MSSLSGPERSIPSVRWQLNDKIKVKGEIHDLHRAKLEDYQSSYRAFLGCECGGRASDSYQPNVTENEIEIANVSGSGACSFCDNEAIT